MKKASFKINGLSCDAYSETAKDICSYSYNGMWAEDMKNPNGVNDVENFIGGHIRTDKASVSFNGAWAEDIDQEEIPRVKKTPPRRESGYFSCFCTMLHRQGHTLSLVRMVSPIASAAMTPDFGFLTERIAPSISASTSEYSKARSAFSIRQLTSFSRLQ